MLTHRDLGEPVLASPSPHLEKRQERADLLFDGVETDELIEIGLDLGERARWTDAGRRPGATPTSGQELLSGAASGVPSLQESFSKFFTAQDPSILTDRRTLTGVCRASSEPGTGKLRSRSRHTGPENHDGGMAKSARAETRRQQWQRRIRTIPIMLGATGAAIIFSPFIVLVAAISDIARRRPRIPTVRTFLFMLHYGLNDSVEILCSPLLWVVAGCGTRLHSEASIKRHQRLQTWSLRLLVRRAEQLLGLRISVDDSSRTALLPAPAIVVCRHVSVFDASLPSALYLGTGVDVRGVIMAELLADPGFDLLYGRLGSLFIPRDNGPDARAQVAHFGRTMHGSSVAVIFPEGRLFRPDVAQRSLVSIAKTDAARAGRLQNLRHVLPPRPGGFAELLDACPGVDVVVISHTGLESYGALHDLARDVPLNEPINVVAHRYRREQIPADPSDATSWLDDRWLEMDEWIHARLTPAP